MRPAHFARPNILQNNYLHFTLEPGCTTRCPSKQACATVGPERFAQLL
jgi:hypothetical protein